MKPIKFKGQTITFGEGQDEFIPLPAMKRNDTVSSLWKATWCERLLFLWHGKMWCQQLTFDNKFQAQKLELWR